MLAARGPLPPQRPRERRRRWHCGRGLARSAPGLDTARRELRLHLHDHEHRLDAALRARRASERRRPERGHLRRPGGLVRGADASTSPRCRPADRRTSPGPSRRSPEARRRSTSSCCPARARAARASGLAVSPALDVRITERRTLNTGGVLPLALGVPAFLGLRRSACARGAPGPELADAALLLPLGELEELLLAPARDTDL